MNPEISPMTRALLRAALLWMLCAPAFAHELQANRVTLVLRENNHLSLTFFVGYVDALHRALAPQRSLQDFVLVHAAMPPQAFAKELLRAQETFRAGTRITSAGGTPLAIDNWIWPDPARTQAALQELAMRAVVAPQEHAHEAPVEIRAEATSPADISSVEIRLPESFQPVLVVSYRPTQAWSERGKPAPRVKF
jgi:hypothetical protein